MGTIANKINKVKNTKDKIKTITNLSTLNAITSETIFKDYPKQILKEYVKIINNGTDELYTNFPKVEDEGTKLELDTEKGPLRMILEGNTSQKTSVLPEEYTQVEYIESTGTQYINTEVNADDINYSFDIDFYGYETQPTTYHRNFGYQRNGGIFLGNKFWYGNNTNINCTDDLGTFNDERHSVFANKDYAIVDNVKYNLNTPPTDFIKNTSTKIAIFGAFDGGDGAIRNDSLSKIKLYSFKIYHNNNLIRNFIPAIRKSDSVAGLYDLVTNTFYTNQGTGIFTYGSVVQIPNPDYPQNIKVVTGEQNVEIHNKNLFDTNDLVQGYISDTIMDNRTNTTRTNAILLKAGTYTYSLKCKNSTWIKMVKYANATATTGTFIFNLQSANYSKTFTLNEDTYVRLGFDTNLSNILANATIQIEFGPTASDCVEHQSQTYPLSLGNIELARINNYKDYIFKNEVGSPYYNADLDLNEWYLHKEIGKITLSNSDSFTLDSYSLRFTKVLDTIYKQGGYSNRYIYGGTYQTTGKFEILRNGRLAFNYPDSNIDTVAELQTYLTTNELYMYLPLSTPTNTKITDTTLISQLENIYNNAKSYSDTTVIECSSVNDNNEAIQASIIALKNIN